jgi:hypothetical protein
MVIYSPRPSRKSIIVTYVLLYSPKNKKQDQEQDCSVYSRSHDQEERYTRPVCTIYASVCTFPAPNVRLLKGRLWQLVCSWAHDFDEDASFLDNTTSMDAFHFRKIKHRTTFVALLALVCSSVYIFIAQVSYLAPQLVIVLKTLQNSRLTQRFPIAIVWARAIAQMPHLYG